MLAPLNAPQAMNVVVHGMSAVDYFAAPGLNHSSMRRLHPTPAHFLVERDPDEVTTNMILGTLVHAAVLDPEAPLAQIAVLPKELSLTTKEGRKWRDDQRRSGFLVLKPHEVDRVRGMALALARHPILHQVLRNGYSEVSCFRTVNTSHGRVVLKARVDFVPGPEWDFLLDIKTTGKADEWAFRSSVTRLRYYGAAAHYLDTYNALCPDTPRSDMLFFVVEDEPRHQVACYRLTSEFLEMGRAEVAEDIETYAACTAAHSFPGYPLDPVAVEPPQWKQRLMQEEGEEAAQ